MGSDGSTNAPAGPEEGAPDRPERPAVPVSQAFSLGWNISRLYLANEPARRCPWETPPDRLPSPALLSEAERSLIRLGQVKAEIGKLDKHIAAGDGDGKLKEAIAQEVNSLEPKIDGSPGSATPRAGLCQVHLSLSHALSCCDGRLAKAYQLGVSLAFTCYEPKGAEELRREFKRSRVTQMGEWLADLSALFPDHASRAVRISCSNWRRWVDEPKVRSSRVSKLKDCDLEAEWKQVRRALARQGEVWRALLCDEKPGTAMLELHNYVAAGGRALRNGFGLARRLGPWLVFPLALLVIGMAAFITLEGAGYKLAGLAAVAGSVGLTWKGFFGSVGGIMGKLQGPVWGAALDEEIADAITILPPQGYVPNEEPQNAAPASGPQTDALALYEEVDEEPELAL